VCGLKKLRRDIQQDNGNVAIIMLCAAAQAELNPKTVKK